MAQTIQAAGPIGIWLRRFLVYLDFKQTRRIDMTNDQKILEAVRVKSGGKPKLQGA